MRSRLLPAIENPYELMRDVLHHKPTKDTLMKMLIAPTTAAIATLILGTGAARADHYKDGTQIFKNASQSAAFFAKSYAYAIFPTIGQGGFVVGGAHGRGQVYSQGTRVGESTVTQLSVGFQAGGQAYSEIIFFKDKRALDEFETGQFQFGAGASAIAITAAAGAGASTQGVDAGVSGGEKDADVAGGYYKGMAVFTIAKGGLMSDASLEGEKFSFKSVKS
jgi:lipid-binding SYLF domain-containing protein